MQNIGVVHKMEKDPNYKKQGGEVGLLNILEELPLEKLSNYIFFTTTRT